MKTKQDPRHLTRTHLMRELFAWDFRKDKKPSDLKEVVENLEQIDRLIKAAAAERPITEINKIDLAILRLSIFELIMKRGVPYKVVVDEAVELGKEFGSNSSASFINGVLGKVIEEQKINE
ncbi:MAG: transcription antitermination factor NusB [Candidatus Daviesbacteria bacterium]|nr:transcription antitermination factor NusB [Candidatus Daviesbacteria bacterium]